MRAGGQEEAQRLATARKKNHYYHYIILLLCVIILLNNKRRRRRTIRSLETCDQLGSEYDRAGRVELAFYITYYVRADDDMRRRALSAGSA